MSYNRKQFDKKKLKKLADEHANWFGGSYYNEDKKRYVHIWKSGGKKSFWAVCKRIARRKARLFLKRHDYYSKQADDLWWNVW